MTKNKIVVILALATSILICTSCWDGVEINRRAVIFSLGIDKNMDPMDSQDTTSLDNPPRYIVSYAIPDMGKVSGNESISKDVVSIEAAKSTTFSTTIEEVQTRTQDTINFGHAKAVLLGADLLRDPDMMKEIIDSLERNMIFARSIPLFAVRDTAQKVMDVKNDQHPIIGLYIMNYINNKERAVSRYKEALLGNTIRDLRENNAAVIPIIEMIDDSKIEIKGGALLKDFKLKAWFTPEEIRGILWAEGKVRGAKISIPIEQSYVSYTVREQDSKISFFTKDNKVCCKIDITNEGDIGEYYINAAHSLTDLESIRQIESQINNKIKKEMTHLIDQTKQYDTDVIGLGTELYRQHPKWWDHVADNWDDSYRNMAIEINVDTKIRRTGIIE
ncbi:MAG TPA: Ger(x)C family spore germination protein [Epulopiscium sp.]|nr:Ger(x)C family spore germination protein [Candidatus Epulonipiscium sp.]